MPFDAAMDSVVKYVTEREAAIASGKPTPWFYDGFSSPKAAEAAFDTTTENEEWSKIREDMRTSDRISELTGVTNRLAWMCGIRHDLRMQYLAGADSHARSMTDTIRHWCAEARWVAGGLQRFRALQQRLRSGGAK